MKTRKITAIILSALMALSTSSAAATSVFAEEVNTTTLTAEPDELVTVQWSNGQYPVIQNDKGEYIAIGKAGTPVKYNGLQIQTTTTEKDGKKTVETVRYTFKDGKCTDVKTLSNGKSTAPDPNEGKEVASTKVTYSNDKYALSEDNKQVVTANGSRPVKYNGLLIRTTKTEYTDGSSSTKNERFNFKDGVLQESK